MNFYYRDLEKAVEDLSELLESPIEAENIPTLRQQVTNKTVCLIPCYLQISSWLNQLQTIHLGLRTQTKRDRIRRHRSWIFGRQMEMECRCRWVWWSWRLKKGRGKDSFFDTCPWFRPTDRSDWRRTPNSFPLVLIPFGHDTVFISTFPQSILFTITILG